MQVYIALINYVLPYRSKGVYVVVLLKEIKTVKIVYQVKTESLY